MRQWVGNTFRRTAELSYDGIASVFDRAKGGIYLIPTQFSQKIPPSRQCEIGSYDGEETRVAIFLYTDILPPNYISKINFPAGKIRLDIGLNESFKCKTYTYM